MTFSNRLSWGRQMWSFRECSTKWGSSLNSALKNTVSSGSFSAVWTIFCIFYHFPQYGRNRKYIHLIIKWIFSVCICKHNHQFNLLRMRIGLMNGIWRNPGCMILWEKINFFFNCYVLKPAFYIYQLPFSCRWRTLSWIQLSSNHTK